MLTDVLMHSMKQPPSPREGDLYKEVTVAGKIFRLLYGYYESFEREGPLNDPMPLYPDFTKEPHYTEAGIPIVTAMQNVCRYYSGKNDEDSCCADCVFFQQSEDLFGFCNCLENKRVNDERVVVNSE